jgi:hypothetical protein
MNVPPFVLASLVGGAVLATVVLLFGPGRRTRSTAAAWASLRSGEPRRARARLRFARRAGDTSASSFAAEALTLFWAGRHEQAVLVAQRAIRRAVERNDLVAARRASAVWILALALDGRAEEASARFASASASSSWEPLRGPHPELSREVVEAIVRFHTGERIAGGYALERVVTSGFRGPVTHLAAFHSAALAHDEGRLDDAKGLLERIVAADHATFLARWARKPLESLGGSRARPPELESERATGRIGLLEQLVDGVRLLYFRGGVASRLAFDPARIAALFAMNAAIVSAEVAVSRSRGEPIEVATPAVAVGALIVLPLVLVLACVLVRPRRSDAPTRLLALVYSMLPLVLLVHTAMRIEHVEIVGRVEILLGTWLLAALVVSQKDVHRRSSWLRRSLVALPVVALLGATGPLGARATERLAIGADELVRDASPKRPSDADRVLAGFRDSTYVRNRRAIEEVVSLVHGEDALKPGVAGVEEMYFLGLAGWGREDVFLNEVTSVRQRFDDRFGTEGRSLTLINAPDGGVHAPASEASLRHALAAFGSRMNVDEDVMVLYLTSHGGREGLALARSGPPLDLVPWSTLSPAAVRSALDEARIGWRVVIVAGCETGVFVDALQDEHTVVATAAARDRVSYGCGMGRASTEYGARFLSATSARGATLLGALELSQEMSPDELRRVFVPSLPRLSIGRAIETKLGRMAVK